MSIEFENSDVESDEEVLDENSETESISFESDEEEENEEEENDEDEEESDIGSEESEIDDECIGDDEDGKEGIDLSEFYDEKPKKSAKANFKRRKRNKPSTVAKSKKVKKKDEILVLPNYILVDVRDKTTKVLEKIINEKNSKIVEKHIFNHTVRYLTSVLGRTLKKADLSTDQFKHKYTSVSYEIITSISSGKKCKEIIASLESNKTGLNSDYFRNEQFNDNQETSNIENPPQVMRGIHTCSRCIKDEDMKDDPDRGKKTESYQVQTRSCDEPMTTFVKCIDCGKRWKF